MILMGTISPPAVDLESRKSPANEAAWNKPSWTLQIISHMIELPIVFDLTQQSFVASLFPLCY